MGIDGRAFEEVELLTRNLRQQITLESRLQREMNALQVLEDLA